LVMLRWPRRAMPDTRRYLGSRRSALGRRTCLSAPAGRRRPRHARRRSACRESGDRNGQARRELLIVARHWRNESRIQWYHAGRGARSTRVPSPAATSSCAVSRSSPYRRRSNGACAGIARRRACVRRAQRRRGGPGGPRDKGSPAASLGCATAEPDGAAVETSGPRRLNVVTAGPPCSLSAAARSADGTLAQLASQAEPRHQAAPSRAARCAGSGSVWHACLA
jgi:hypothetical protein